MTRAAKFKLADLLWNKEYFWNYYEGHPLTLNFLFCGPDQSYFYRLVDMS
jgi:hypothetical protein